MRVKTENGKRTLTSRETLRVISKTIEREGIDTLKRMSRRQYNAAMQDTANTLYAS